VQMLFLKAVAATQLGCGSLDRTWLGLATENHAHSP
jgi:hypothetical protein